MHAGKAGTVRPSYRIVIGLERLAKECGVPTEPTGDAANSIERGSGRLGFSDSAHLQVGVSIERID